jgi:altronate dehydratase
MSQPQPFHQVARLADDSDNVAIAVRVLSPGTQIAYQGQTLELPHGVLEGHRFAITEISEGESLLSWGLPFGSATQAIAPGQYICNTGMLEALSLRSLPHALPGGANFVDDIRTHILDEGCFTPGLQIPPAQGETETFDGYDRGPRRGVGTRNFVVILTTSSQTGSFARILADRCNDLTASSPHIDGVVAVAHTEGSGHERPNNLDFVLRTLAGFTVHANVGAVLIVDQTGEPVDSRMLQAFLADEHYPIQDARHAFLTVGQDFATALQKGEQIIRGWLPVLDADRRTTSDLAHLKVALQCGGSDAFSGISGNPLIAWVARALIEGGGSANLAETDELIGAESYILSNVRDLATARKFLEIVARFKELAAWHGTTAEGNPSGGNKYRGLYNIVLKSLGAAMKRHPEVRLDDVIDYAVQMAKPGYYFMNSPGNDLESIAGQVASGCNVIFFVTGNGSITNFPFVPTLKVITTTARYEMLANEMDVNAGEYLDGVPMDRLGRRMLDQTLAVASGERSKGELAGHAQVSIWRNWRQGSTRDLARAQSIPAPTGRPIQVEGVSPTPDATYRALWTEAGPAVDCVGLILPTSLCSSEIARIAAERFTQAELGKEYGVTRHIALTHTEGCGVGGGPSEALYARTVAGYLQHPAVRLAVLLEHGCEKTHNDYMRHEMASRGMSPESFGWASVQMDGGIENAVQNAERWIRDELAAHPPATGGPSDLARVRIGLLADAAVPDEIGASLAEFTRRALGADATIIASDASPLLHSGRYLPDLVGTDRVAASLPHGQIPDDPGFHVMESQTDHFVEILTGMGGCGVQVVVAYTQGRLLQGHPLIPVIQVSGPEATGNDGDLALCGDPTRDADDLFALLLMVASRKHTVAADALGNVDVQFTRGLLGISM